MTDKPALGALVYFALCFLAILYFAFAAVRGDLGVIERLTVASELTTLESERDRLLADISEMKNKTYRLSDGFLDLDLLDEQARDVLGYLRPDELVLQ